MNPSRLFKIGVTEARRAKVLGYNDLVMLSVMTRLEDIMKKLLGSIIIAFAALAVTAPVGYACDGGSYGNQGGNGK
jgi:hypothetical protein